VRIKLYPDEADLLGGNRWGRYKFFELKSVCVTGEELCTDLETSVDSTIIPLGADFRLAGIYLGVA
jgi:hypothetical protein